MTLATETGVRLPADWIRPDGRFRPFAKYSSIMDQVIYLDADVAYRADRVDSFLTLFWAPDSYELVGFKLKGFRLLFDTLRTVSTEIAESDFVPFIKLFELAALASWSEISQRVDGTKLQKRYEVAKKFVSERAAAQRVRISDLELNLAA